MMRIQWTRLTVKALHKRLQQAYAAGAKRLVRRLSVLLAVGQRQTRISEAAKSPSSGASVWLLFTNGCRRSWWNAWPAYRIAVSLGRCS